MHKITLIFTFFRQMSFPRKRIAIVGGGFCGLASVDGMKEAGFDPVCFEQTDKAGGTWCYGEKSFAGIGSTYNYSQL